MKVINSLIAVEVPMGVKYTVRESELAIFRSRALSVIQLPFPAEIIGLASEIDETGKVKVLECLNHLITSNVDECYDRCLSYFDLTTTPTTDIIFLRKKL